MFDRILIAILKWRLRRKPGFFSEVTEAALDYWAGVKAAAGAVKAAEAAARVSAADEAIAKLSKRVELQRFVSDTVGTTNSLPIQ